MIFKKRGLIDDFFEIVGNLLIFLQNHKYTFDLTQ